MRTEIYESESDGEQRRRYRYVADITAPELGTTRQHRTFWGVSTITIETLRDGRKPYLLHALSPNRVNATDRVPGERPWAGSPWIRAA